MRSREEAQQLLDDAKLAQSENRLQDAAQRFMEAQQAFDEIGDAYMCIRCINQLGIVYGNMDNESMAIDCYLSGLDYMKEHKMEGGKNLFFNNIGTRYLELGAYEKALEYFYMANADLEQNADKVPGLNVAWYVVGYLNIGISAFYQGNLEEAETYLKKAYDASIQEGVNTYLFSIQCTLARVYLSMGSEEYTRDHLQEIMDYAKMGRNEQTASDYTQDIIELVYILKALNEPELWKTCLNYYDKMVEEQNSVTLELQSAEFWLEYYQAQGMEQEWRDMCVRHTQLYHKQKETINAEKITALNAKIELYRIKNEMKDAERKSECDALTGLKNRYAMNKYGADIVKEAIDTKTQLMVGFLDIDCFKAVNDTYGHLHGDKILKEIANILFQSVDGYGEVFRYGGDEFVVVVPNATPKITSKLTKKIFKQVADAHIKNENSAVASEVTISMGVYCLKPKENMALEKMVDKADDILYEVKGGSKNDYKIVTGK